MSPDMVISGTRLSLANLFAVATTRHKSKYRSTIEHAHALARFSEKFNGLFLVRHQEFPRPYRTICSYATDLPTPQ